MPTHGGRPAGEVAGDLRRSDEAVNRIIASIYEQRLAPGSRLPAERSLVRHLGVSRPVVREALRHLEDRGFVEIRAKSGAYVCSTLPTPLRAGLEELARSHPKWFADAVHVRSGLDHYFMPAVIRHQTPALLGELSDCVEIMERNANTQRKVQFENHSRADVEFHRVLAKMTGNAVYLHLMDFLADLVFKEIRYSRELLDTEYGSLNVAVHREVLDAIQAKDLGTALRAIDDHYRFSLEARV